MKSKTYDFKSFMSGDLVPKVKRKPPTMSLLPLAAAPLIPTKASAEDIIQVQVMEGFAPLIDLIQGVAYPIALAAVMGGALFIMIGNAEKGFGMMQKAGIGYVTVMISPIIVNALANAMKGLS